MLRDRFNALPPYLQATIFAVTGAVSAALFSVIVRLATRDIDPLQAVFFRNLFDLILIALIALRGGFAGVRTQRLPMFSLRAILSMASMSFWFSALAYLPLAEATTLNFTVPLFGTLLAAVFLREKIRQYRIGAILIGFCGVLIIIRPGSDTMQMASLLPIIAALCMASAALTTKSLARTESPTSIIFYMMLLTTPMTLIPALMVWKTPSVMALVLMGVGALVANITQICNTNAYRVYEYSFVIGFNYVRLPFVIIIAFALFGEIPQWWLLPGATLIIGAALFIARREARLSKQSNRITAGPGAVAGDLDPPSSSR
ncbi:DMT family transporter [Thalassospira sp. MA62]|nr:DMT family transporter [Thalassospira sp. MA62]